MCKGLQSQGEESVVKVLRCSVWAFNTMEELRARFFPGLAGLGHKTYLLVRTMHLI